MAQADGASVHYSRARSASMKSNKVAALLLAAGQSRRMGAFKPLHPFGDSTVVDSRIANLRDASVDEIIVVVGHRADVVREHLQNANVAFALNDDLTSEMSVSIARGVEEVSGQRDALLIALVDHPAVSSDTIKTIVDAWLEGAQFVQPEFNGRGGHPGLI